MLHVEYRALPSPAAPAPAADTAAGGALRGLWRALGILLIAAVTLLGAGYVYGKLTHTVYRAELSGSMRPLLTPGDLLAIQQVRASDLKVGDIVTVARPDRGDELVTHRLIALRRDRIGLKLVLTTKGDANTVADPPGAIAPDRPVGRYRFSVPWLGHATTWLSTRSYRIVLIWVAVLAIFAPELLRRRA
jgi:signal peptidase I